MGDYNFIYASMHVALIKRWCLYLVMMTRIYSQNCHVSVYQLWVNWSEVQVGGASVCIPIDDYRRSSQNYWVSYVILVVNGSGYSFHV